MTHATGTPRLLFRPIVCLAVSFVVLVGLARPLMAGSEINTGYFGNVAIKGYDPVAYFTEDKAMKGSEDHSLEWLGANWQFTSDAHKQAFAADPTKYAPQYGGHCAVGVAFKEVTNDIDPEAWVIIDGKLYLNYSKQVGKSMSEEHIAKADENWRELRKRAAK
jgi:YHS domain-containing protein